MPAGSASRRGSTYSPIFQQPTLPRLASQEGFRSTTTQELNQLSTGSIPKAQPVTYTPASSYYSSRPQYQQPVSYQSQLLNLSGAGTLVWDPVNKRYLPGSAANRDQVDFLFPTYVGRAEAGGGTSQFVGRSQSGAGSAARSQFVGR